MAEAFILAIIWVAFEMFPKDGSNNKVLFGYVSQGGNDCKVKTAVDTVEALMDAQAEQ